MGKSQPPRSHPSPAGRQQGERLRTAGRARLGSARLWLADLLMACGLCSVVAGSPFGLVWYVIPPLIFAGIGAALVGLALAPGWWRASVFAGIATSWMLAGPIILIGLAVAKFVWPGRRATDRRLLAADHLMLLATGCVAVGWLYGGWAAPLAVGAATALTSLLLDRRTWRAGVAAVAVIAVAAALR